MSRCNTFGDLPQASMSPPIIGNTYEITIGPFDQLIVTVQHHEDNAIQTKTKIKPIGIAIKPLCEVDPFSVKDPEKMVYETDFSVRHIHDNRKK
jgi:hypothetical protein